MSTRIRVSRFHTTTRPLPIPVHWVLLFLIIAAIPAWAQTPDTQKPEDPAQAPQKTSKTADREGFQWGLMEGRSEFEIGYRWISQAGNRDMYRSMINLGEGPKVFRSSLSLRSNYGSGTLFDRLDLSIDNWGGDPYNTMRLSFSRMDLYEFRANYRNLNYYNFIPSYSNPLLTAGNMLGQHSLNVTHRMTDLELKLFPRSRIRPFVGYARSSGFGPGYTTFRSTGNEFLLDTRWQYGADDYRGGVELSLPRLTLTLEQGYRFLRNDTSVSREDPTGGNISRTFLGQKVVLDSLNRGYHDRTKIPFSKLVAKFTPWSRLELTARYVYALANVESSFSQIDAGNLISLEEMLAYQSAADSYNARAKRPGHTGGFALSYSPFSRLTLLNNFDTRSYHISGGAVLNTVYYKYRSLTGLTDGKSDRQLSHLRDSLLAYDQTRNQLEFELDLGAGLTVRAGHRYTYLETTLEKIDPNEKGRTTGDFNQQTAIAGFAFDRGEWLRLTLDYENNQTDRALTRTDPFDFDQFRLGWKYRPWKKLHASGHIAFLRNSNEATDIDLNSHNRNYVVALNFEPSERFFLSLDYSRTNIYSDLAIVLPQTLDLDRSLFDERSHGVGGSIGIEFPRRTRVDFGYRGILSVGSFPLNYHQPFASVSIPLPGRMIWKAGWQYYGYNEKGASMQDHRNHLITASMVFAY